MLGNTALPPVPLNDLSIVPLLLYRAMAKPLKVEKPVAMILPSGWRASPSISSSELMAGTRVVKPVMTYPPVPKVGSNAPFGRSRTMAKSLSLPVRVA